MEIRTFLVGISPLSKIVLMVAMEIAHFYIVHFMFEDKSILHYMDNEQFDSYEKKNPSWCGGKVKLTLVLFGIIEAYGKFIQFTYS